MSVFHVRSVCANANARGVDALGRLCEHVDTFCTRRLVGEDFERVERELHERGEDLKLTLRSACK